MPLPSAGNVLRVRFPGVSHRYSVLKPATVRHVAVAFLALEKSPNYILYSALARLAYLFSLGRRFSCAKVSLPVFLRYSLVCSFPDATIPHENRGYFFVPKRRSLHLIEYA